MIVAQLSAINQSNGHVFMRDFQMKSVNRSEIRAESIA